MSDEAGQIEHRPRLYLKGIIAIAAKLAGVRVDVLTSERRDADLVAWRQAAMAVAYDRGAWSLPQIGRAFGGRDHTTVLHGLARAGMTPCRQRVGVNAEVVERRAKLETAIHQWPVSAPDPVVVAPKPPIEVRPEESPSIRSLPKDFGHGADGEYPVAIADGSPLARRWWVDNDRRFRQAFEASGERV